MKIFFSRLLGEIYLFCKGADSSIFPRVVEGKVDQIRSRVERNAVVRCGRRPHASSPSWGARSCWVPRARAAGSLATCPWAGTTLRSPPLVFGGEGVQNDKHVVTVLKKIDLYPEDIQ